MSLPKEKTTAARRVALAAILSAVAVVLSPVVTFPLPLATPFPVQHMVNAIAGVLLGPWYAVMIAIVVGSVRYILGTGTIHAFPGGVFGGLVVGLAHKYLLKKDYAAFLEPIGTVLLGAAASAMIFGPIASQMAFRGRTGTFESFMILFAPSSIPGCVLGYLVLRVVRRTGIWH